MALHRGLEGKGPLPEAFWLSRVCEEFNCLPTVARREMRRVPVGLLEDILEARAYAAAKQVYEDHPRGLPRTPLIQLVQQIDFELAQEELTKK